MDLVENGWEKNDGYPVRGKHPLGIAQKSNLTPS